MTYEHLIAALCLFLAGCGTTAMNASRTDPQGLMRQQALSGGPDDVPRTDRSHHLYVLLLKSQNAFSTDAERERLWAALRGEDARYVELLGNLNDVPMDYRIEYVFNHTTPNAKNAEMHLIKPWLKRLSRTERSRASQAKTVLLVKGNLFRLPNSQDVRLTLAGLLFLAETYDGIIVDLLSRKAMAATELRTLLEAPGRLASQIRFVGGRVDGQLGVRTAGLPKYGFPDVFLPTETPTTAVKRLGLVVDALMTGEALPSGVSPRRCKKSRLDFGCYRID
ncbi:MAG: hypothetical protein ACPGQS_03210 [Bradymonadia bacterium]